MKSTFNSRWGFLKYYFSRNHLLWESLSIEDKNLVLKNNVIKNNMIYFDSEKYDLNHGHLGDPTLTLRGKKLMDFVEEEKPEAVLELGPAQGYYTDTLFSSGSIKKYVGVDIVPGFIEFLKRKYQKHIKNKTFDIQLWNCDGLEYMRSQPSGSFDLVLCYSCLHHIPDRLNWIQEASRIIKLDGSIYGFDPTHYLWRYRNLVRRYAHIIWKGFKHRIGNGNPCTHHFLTLSELKYWESNSDLILREITFYCKKRRIPSWCRYLAMNVAIC